MAAEAEFDQVVPAQLAALGIEADEVELAVMRAAHELWWPALVGLLETDLPGIEAERDADMSRGPQGP